MRRSGTEAYDWPMHRCLLLLVLILAPACSKAPTTTTNKVRALTAAQWEERAKDRDERICKEAAHALHDLGSEGIPSLFRAYQAQEPGSYNRAVILQQIDAHKVLDADLPKIAAVLDDKEASEQARLRAVVMLGDVGPRARAFADKVEAIGKQGEPFDQAAKYALERMKK